MTRFVKIQTKKYDLLICYERKTVKLISSNEQGIKNAYLKFRFMKNSIGYIFKY